MSICFKPAEESDIEFIMSLEGRAEYASHITQWDLPAHRSGLTDPDKLYRVVTRDGEPVGYFIIEGLASAHATVCLLRIVVASPGGGLGGVMLEEVKRLAFEELDAKRLWLDVVPGNDRAKRVYERAGFIEEGTLRSVMVINHRRVSLIIMSMLAEEYRALNR